MDDIPIIYQPLKNAKRIKIYIPYQLKEIRDVFKKINTTFWHPNQKLWSIMYTQENVVLLKNLFGKNYKSVHEVSPTPIEKRPLNQYAIEQLFRLEKALVLKKYSAASFTT